MNSASTPPGCKVPPQFPGESLRIPRHPLKPLGQKKSHSSVSQEIVDTVNGFGFQLQGLTTNSDTPNGLCAINIYLCLMMAAAGSQNRNLEAFAKVLRFDQANLRDTVGRIAELDDYCTRSGNDGIELTSAGSVWHRPDFVLENEWVNTMKTTFRATFGPLNVASINEFVKLETRGRI